MQELFSVTKINFLNRALFFLATFICYLTFMCAWNMVALFFLQKIKIFFPGILDSKKSVYKIKKWEQSGKFYSKVLKIKLWKDKLPQYIEREGFSKAHLKSIRQMTPEYLDEFIRETCLGELCHIICAIFPFVFVFFYYLYKESIPTEAIIFALGVLIVNFAYIFIQRYNRNRLEKIRRKF